jgi:hypothetical protein
VKVSFSSEQEEFRSNLRRLLADRSPTKEVRRLMETDHGYERDGWRAINSALGLTAIRIPEALKTPPPGTEMIQPYEGSNPPLPASESRYTGCRRRNCEKGRGSAGLRNGRPNRRRAARSLKVQRQAIRLRWPFDG